MSNVSFNGERRPIRRSHTKAAPCDSKDCSMSGNCSRHKNVKIGGLDYKATFSRGTGDGFCVGFKAKVQAV